MGNKKVRLTADPALARAHAAGSKVRLVQPCVHEKFGPLWVAQPRHAAVHLIWASRMRARLRELDGQVFALEVGDGGGRTVDDPDLIASLYTAGVDVAVHTVLAWRHLILRLEALSPGNIGSDDSTARFGAVLRRLGYRADLGADPRYARLCEIENLRHLIEHPTSENVYTADMNAWERVPLTWIASGRAASAYDQALELLTEIGKFAESIDKRRKGPGTLLGVRRGIKATNPAKKPPRSAS